MVASFPFAVCGLHMVGCPLNHQMQTAGATLLREAKTTSDYSLHVLSNSDGTGITKPALVRHPAGGAATAATTAAIAIEVWDMPVNALGRLFADTVVKGAQAGGASPLAFGVIALEDGTNVTGFVGEGWAADKAACSGVGIDAVDITKFGGWREWKAETSRGDTS